VSVLLLSLLIYRVRDLPIVAYQGVVSVVGLLAFVVVAVVVVVVVVVEVVEVVVAAVAVPVGVLFVEMLKMGQNLAESHQGWVGKNRKEDIRNAVRSKDKGTAHACGDGDVGADVGADVGVGVGVDADADADDVGDKLGLQEEKMGRG